MAVVGALALVAAACGDDDSGGSGEGGSIKVAVVAPSASDDLAFTQSMIDAVDALDAAGRAAASK